MTRRRFVKNLTAAYAAMNAPIPSGSFPALGPQNEYINKYKVITDKGVQVHVRERGCYNKTPHDVTLAWMEDSLSLWHEAGWVLQCGTCASISV